MCHMWYSCICICKIHEYFLLSIQAIFPFFLLISTVFLAFFSHHRQQALLAAISEKDANIALLELSSSKRKKAQEEVMALKREKDRLMHQLKQQVHTHVATKVFTGAYKERMKCTVLINKIWQVHTWPGLWSSFKANCSFMNQSRVTN